LRKCCCLGIGIGYMESWFWTGPLVLECYYMQDVVCWWSCIAPSVAVAVVVELFVGSVGDVLPNFVV
jgi:hypothetical protein